MPTGHVVKLAESIDPDLFKKLLGIPYKIPKNFMSWVYIAAMATVMQQYKVRELLASGEIDQAVGLHAGLWQVWLKDNWPIYCISKDLVLDFFHTDIEGIEKLIVEDWVPPLPGFLLLLPENLLKTPSGLPVNYLIVHFDHPSFPKISLVTEHPCQVSIALFDSNGVCWVSGLGISKEGKLMRSKNQLGTTKVDDIEHRFLEQLQSLVLQATMTLQYMPELIEEETGMEHVKKQEKTYIRPSKKERLIYRQPRWIGKSYKRSGISSSVNTGSSRTHKSPISHWRSGHWRGQRYGENYALQRVIYIKPTRVNSI